MIYHSWWNFFRRILEIEQIQRRRQAKGMSCPGGTLAIDSHHFGFGFGFGIGDDSADGEQGELPYTEAFAHIVENCMGLKYIDLEGLRSNVDNISLMEYTLDSDALQHARCDGVNVKILATDTGENGTSNEEDDNDEDSDCESEDFTEEEIGEALVRVFGLQLRG